MQSGSLIAQAAAQHFIKRPRLTRVLDESEARIILLVAPAGYGKTTLAREWLADREGAVWYGGGAGMADVAALALGIAHAVADASGQGHEEAVERVQLVAAQEQSPVVLARAVARAVPADCAILAIDDYHHIAESATCELFLKELLSLTSFRLVLTSRVRPDWVAPRLVVYGEADVLEMVDLAFTADEAEEVLRQAGGRTRERVLAQARGWPAVIGLAAMRRDAARPDASLRADDLYDFFAEDLFRRASPAVRRALFLLALGADVDTAVATELLGAETDPLLAQAVEQGFVGRDPPRAVAIHPLLKTFLLVKLHDLPEDEVEAMVGRVVAASADRGHWDACLGALQRFPKPDALGATLERALPDLLSGGRVATVKRWIELAAATDGSDQPIVLLAEAEVAFREGDERTAQVLAERAGDLLRQVDSAARAYVLAARAAHLRNDHAATTRNCKRADAVAVATAPRVEALWIEFLHAIERPEEDARSILRRLREVDDERP